MSLKTKTTSALAALTMLVTVTVVGSNTAQARPDISVVGTVCKYAGGTPFAIPCKIVQNANFIKSLLSALTSLWSCSGRPDKYVWERQNHRWPSGTTTTNPMTLVGIHYKSSESNRMSPNIDNSIFRDTGRWVYVLYADVRTTDRTVKFGIRADRPWRFDENRSNLFSHGQWVWVSKKGSNDCGYYIANTTGMARPTFAARNPNAKILLIAQ